MVIGVRDDKKLGFALVNFLPQSLFILVQNFKDGATFLCGCPTKEQTVVCKEQMRDLWTCTTKRDSFD